MSTTSTPTCSEPIFVKFLMVLLIGFRGKSSHINLKAALNSLIVFGPTKALGVGLLTKSDITFVLFEHFV